MTLFDLLTTVNKQFPNADKDDICRIANELESRIINEIFSPHGIESKKSKSNEKSDIHSKLILEDEYASLYIYFIYVVLSIKELDFETSNTYSLLFNKKFEELAVFYRRNHLPIKNTAIKEGI